MEHGRHLVDLVDENGLVVGSKLRRHDLPNMYVNRLGATPTFVYCGNDIKLDYRYKGEQYGRDETASRREGVDC
jgi:hypothetical protein